MVRMDLISFDDVENPGEHQIIHSDSYEPKPLHVEEAAVQLTKSSHEFLVFVNADNDKVNVIYKLRSGGLGLIDPDV